MMGMRLPLGIEKGKDFKPDVATVARLNSAAAEAHAWLLAQIPTFLGRLNVWGIEAFGEPTVYVGEQSACFVVSAERSHI